ncbi:MAG: shikimate dehydrogenase [Candidatus Marinimicrobia bacterium]|nr:shikimate dehydrogenase [Candidatus Neomarinimicrobiota bacterium]
MLITGIIGYPLDMTLSPRMHTAAFQAKKIDGAYLRIPVEPARLEDVLDALRVIGCRGVNVTNPHKETLLLFLNEISKEAEEVGAVNTVVFGKDGLSGHNTDIYGFRVLLQNADIDLAQKSVLLIGAGGVAKAAAWVLSQSNLHNLYVTDIITAKAETLAAQYGATVVHSNPLHSLLNTTDMVINASSVDLQDDVTPFMQRGSLYMDLNYKFPVKKHEGVRSINGLDMLLHQGVRAFEIFTGENAPVDVMKNALGINHD